MVRGTWGSSSGFVIAQAGHAWEENEQCCENWEEYWVLSDEGVTDAYIGARKTKEKTEN